jgi:hypothetical protein
MAEAGDDCELIHCSRNAVVIDRPYDGLRGGANWLMLENSCGGGEGVTLGNECENESNDSETAGPPKA